VGLKSCYTWKSLIQQTNRCHLSTYSFACSILYGTLSAVKWRLSKDDVKDFQLVGQSSLNQRFALMFSVTRQLKQVVRFVFSQTF